MAERESVHELSSVCIDGADCERGGGWSGGGAADRRKRTQTSQRRLSLRDSGGGVSGRRGSGCAGSDHASSATGATQSAAVPAETPAAMPVEKVETQEAAVAGAQEQKPSESAAQTAAPVQASSVRPAATSPALTPTSPPDSGVTLHVNVDVLLVPVVVHDKQDRAVGDLTAKDFTVIDQGKPRPVTGFTVVRSDGSRKSRAGQRVAGFRRKRSRTRKRAKQVHRFSL